MIPHTVGKIFSFSRELPAQYARSYKHLTRLEDHFSDVLVAVPLCGLRCDQRQVEYVEGALLALFSLVAVEGDEVEGVPKRALKCV